MAKSRAVLPVESRPMRMANPLTVVRPRSIEQVLALSDALVARALIGSMVASIIPMTMSPMSVFFMVLHPISCGSTINIILLIY